MFNKLIRRYFVPVISLTTLMSCFSLHATIVEFQTSEGNIQVNLFDKATPKTVENFLSYVNDGTYTDNIIHRSVANFIIQGGGYTINGTTLTPVSKKTAVVNEPIFSNVKGTIAMAKIGGNPNSATSQWFFNLNDNSANLDVQNSGFTAFGHVVSGDIEVMEAIGNITTCNKVGLNDLPLKDYSCTANEDPAQQNFITINQIVIVDSSSATADSLNPTKNTLLPTGGSSKGSDGGGTFFWLLIALCSVLTYRFNIKINKLFSYKSL